MTNKNFKRQRGFSFFYMLLLLIVGYFVWSYIADGDFKDVSAHAEDLRGILEDFAGQKGIAQKAYKDAMDAKDTAVTIGLKFKDDKTQAFITKWQNAADEVSELRRKLKGIDKKANILFSHIDDELEKINDRSLRNKMTGTVEKKANSFAQSLKKTEQAIIVLETSIAKGTDIITAIKISGALGTFSTQIMELDNLAKSADSKFDEIDALVAEGMNILDIELK